MKKLIDGTEIIDGKEMLSYKPNMLPVIKGFAEVLGDDIMEQYLHEALGNEAKYYPDYFDIGLGNDKGWAGLQEQIKLINYIMNKLSVKTGYNYKQWIGKYDHIICQ